MLSGDAFVPGLYELAFDLEGYFRGKGVQLPQPPFLTTVVIRIGIADAGAHYHVPLLASPWSYSTYRGS
jgi:5-hydroxyisourate hydrolase